MPFGTATEADLIAFNGRKVETACELVEGTLVGKLVGCRVADVCSPLMFRLARFAEPRSLGLIFGVRTMYRLAPGLVRSSNVGVVNFENCRAWRRSKAEIADFAPDLAVAILSPGNTRYEAARRRREFFSAGTRMIWEVRVRRKAVTIYTSPTTAKRLTIADTLNGGDVLPGFALPLADLFADPLGD